MRKENTSIFIQGLRDGVPIGLGYLAVAFSLGITAKNSGLNAFQGFLASLFTIASAGEYAAFRVIATRGGYLMMALMILVANCRYLLMSCALAQRVSPGMRFIHRFGIGAFITDEIFAVSIARPGYLKPAYTYGAAAASVLPWAAGTALGVIAGNILPDIVVSALSVAIYGMFLAIIIPPAKKDRVVLGIIPVSFALSAGLRYAFPGLNENIRVMGLTVLISVCAALLFPVKEQEEPAEAPEGEVCRE
ncbi:MAG: branched-chain amino acid ABC transporter permease [Clostridiales bacterium]|nr:branched-chain amino acid ABC transporter permease [Clostridiales bacterium]